MYFSMFNYRILPTLIAMLIAMASVSHAAEPSTHAMDMNTMPMDHSMPASSPSTEQSPTKEHSQTTSPDTSPDTSMDEQELEQPQTPPELIMQQMMRQGSGTAWQPSDNPMLMKMGHLGSWTTMLHGSAFADFDYQGGRRGGYKTISENWIMGSAAGVIGSRGVLQLHGMYSGEPFTVGKNGYPLLFQTGEALNGKPLVDRQHPHDLFMELSAQYFHRMGHETWLSLYGAPVGEPALGPVAFPHRYSDFLIPTAPLSHHILDSTHISFGVGTVGLIHKKWQLEGSVFNSREPDENRYDFDYNQWHTGASGRISYLPTPNWALQISSGYLSKPEQLDNNNLERTTASASYYKTWDTGWWASTLALGHNFEKGPDDNAVLLESTLNFKDKNYVFGRMENIERHGLLQPDESRNFNITAFSLGAARDLFRFKGIPLTLGAMITMYAKPNTLNVHYSDFPISFNVFLHTNAPRMTMNMGGMSQ